MQFEQALKSRRRATIVLVVQCCIATVIACVGLIYQPSQPQFEELIYPACCLLLGLTIWSYYSWYVVTGSLFNPYLLFFLSAVIFNGGQAVLEVFHLNNNGILDGDFSPETLLKTLFLDIICLSFFHLGGLISARKNLTNFKASLPLLKHENDKKKFLITSQATYQISLFLLSISLFPASFVLKNSLSVVAAAGYEGIYQQEVVTSIGAAPAVLADFLIPAALFFLAGSKKKPRSRLLAASIIIIYSLAQFLIGERNKAVMPLISLSWLWNYFIHPLPKLLLFSVSSILVFIIFPLIAVTRNISGEDRFSLQVILDTFSTIENPVVTVISEMGFSMMTVAHTIELVPSIREFSWGAEYFYALLTLMPNLFWDIHPTIARGRPSDWLVEIVNPTFAARGGGYGYSFIAEAYLNFGWLGAPIALGVIGFLFAQFTLWAMQSKDPAKLAMLASFLSVFLFYARADSALQARSLVWYSWLPYLGIRLLTKKQLQKQFQKSEIL